MTNQTNEKNQGCCTHEFITQVTKRPGCDFSGTKRKTCKKCGITIEKEMPPMGHYFRPIGNGKMKCAVCGTIKKI